MAIIDWSRGYSADWQLYRVNPRTWADAERVGRVLDASVSRSISGDAPTIDSASLSLTRAVGEGLPEGWYRLAMVARQGVASERVDVATVWCASTGGTVEFGTESVDVTGRSVLWPCSRRDMAAGAYSPSGVDGARWAADLIRSCTPAPVEVALGASFTLDDAIVFSGKALDAAWQVLEAGGRTIRIGGDGRITIRAIPTDPALSLDAMGVRLLQPGIGRAMDYSQVPNRYTVRYGGEEVVATNDNPNSVTSTVARGMVIDPSGGVDTSPKRVNGESLQGYADRRLEEESVVPDSRTYTREWWPDVHPGDLVRGTMASLGVDGDFHVVSQQLTCGAGIVVEEKASREVHTWLRD